MPTNLQQQTVAYKKVALQVAEIGLTADFPYFASPDSPNTVLGSQVILKDTDIPLTAPTTNLINGTLFDSAGQVTTNANEAVIQYNEALVDAFPGSNNDSYGITAFTGIILPFIYGDGTFAPVFSANSLSGTIIPFGDGDFVFFPEAGVLTFFKGKPATITNNQIGIKYWSYVGDTAADLTAGSPITAQTYVLDISDPPTNAVWNPTIRAWTITHNLASDNLLFTFTVDNAVSVPSITITDANILVLTVSGALNKTNDTVAYPSNVELIINKF